MSNAVIAIQLLNGLLTLTKNATIAASEFGALIAAADARGTPITDEELAELRRQADEVTEEVLKLLEPDDEPDQSN